MSYLRISRRDPDLALIDAALDHAFYRQIAGPAALNDPARHFHTAGWLLGHDPNSWFDCAWYLGRNPDIAAAGIDPFLHYLAHGAAEGRTACAATGQGTAILAGAIAPADRRPGYDAPADAQPLTEAALAAALHYALAGAAALVVSISHDRYIDVTGGMQVLIAQEQALFVAGRVAYLHLSPAVSRLTLAGAGQAFAPLQIVLQGRFLGLVADTVLTEALEVALATASEERLASSQRAMPHSFPRALVVHSVFGHRTASLAALAAALRPQHSYFWLHDYASLCEGFNLLRNDLAYCHAPPADSMACRVCIYGDNRRAYLADLQTLFAAVPFHILAPSRAALDIWLQATELPWQTARVHENARLGEPRRVPRRARRDTAADPIRVAFAGYPMAHKGWPAFLELLRATATMPEYRFHHFAAAGTLPAMDALVSVPTKVTVADPQAMATALAAHEIDLLLLLSPWPETFSYVAHEGLAAGADLVALEVGGNVPDLVRGQDRGVVLPDTEALLHYFTSGEAVGDVRAREAAGRYACAMIGTGTAATLNPAALEQTDPARFHTSDPGLVVLADGVALDFARVGACLRVTLPPGAAIIRLRSRRQEATPGLGAGGTAGLALDAISLGGLPVLANDARRLSGWHDGEGGVSWTDGDASLRADGAAVLELHLNPQARYWQAPITVQPGTVQPGTVQPGTVQPGAGG